MALRLCTNHVMRTTVRRCSTQIEKVQKSELVQTAWKIETLPKGLTVMTREDGSDPFSRVAVINKGGCRSEPADLLGVSHIIRHMPEMHSDFGLGLTAVRRTLQHATTYQMTDTRDLLIGKMEGATEHFASGELLSVLWNTIFKNQIREGELTQIQERLLVDLAYVAAHPQLIASENAHKAAYRDTLGNSLFAPQSLIGSYTRDMVIDQLINIQHPKLLAVCGVNIDHEVMRKFGENTEDILHNVADNPAPSIAPAKYRGGEVTTITTQPVTNCVLVAEGGRLGSKDALAFSVLQQILGTDSPVKYSPGQSRLRAATAKASEKPVEVGAYCASYTDSGLFGVAAAAAPGEMPKVLRAALNDIEALASKGVSDEQVNTAKNRVKTKIGSYGHVEFFAEDIQRAYLTGKSWSLTDMMNEVNSVTKDDVNKALKKFLDGKKSLGTAASAGETLVLDEL